MNWTVLCAMILAFLFLLIFKENDRRLKQDTVIMKDKDISMIAEESSL